MIVAFRDAAPSFSGLLIRWLFLLVIVAVELMGVTFWFESPTIADDASGATWLFANSREIWRIGIGFISVFILSFIPRIPFAKNSIRELQEQSTGYPWWLWLTGHFLAFAAFVFVTSLIFEKPIDPARLSAAWFAGWFALAGATFLLWLLAVAPSCFWLLQARKNYKELLGGLLLGVPSGLLLIGAVGQLMQAELWLSLAEPTLRLVHMQLGWIYSDLVYQPDLFWIGTPSFQVEIFYPCSGYEGIILISVFVAIYLWLFRKDTEFSPGFLAFTSWHNCHMVGQRGTYRHADCDRYVLIAQNSGGGLSLTGGLDRFHPDYARIDCAISPAAIFHGRSGKLIVDSERSFSRHRPAGSPDGSDGCIHGDVGLFRWFRGPVSVASGGCGHSALVLSQGLSRTRLDLVLAGSGDWGCGIPVMEATGTER